MKINKSIFLPGLNGIRAIAAISVIISHIGIHMDYYEFKPLGGYSLASFGVTMFFALSGFLITYLLLKEKEKTNTIAIRKFYIRRILRIWPLYYFYLIFVIVVIGLVWNQYSWMYFLLMPNVPFALTASTISVAVLPYLGHYWSVGVEEQFYAFWPWMVKKSKNILRVMVVFAISFFLIKLCLTLFNAPKFVLTLFHYTRFGCLAMGGIAAFLLVNQQKVFIKICTHKITEISAWGIIVLIAFNRFHLFSIIDHEIVTVATLVIIINQISNSHKIISLENKVFDYLGKISYGLYIYNPLVIYLISIPLNKIIEEQSIINVISIYSVTILVVIAVSHVSYFYFESKLLRFKDNFAVVKSKSSAS